MQLQNNSINGAMLITFNRAIIISNYNLKYPVISNFTVNLENLRFQQWSSKTMNDNMRNFCTKMKLLARKTVLKVSLFQFFY